MLRVLRILRTPATRRARHLTSSSNWFNRRCPTIRERLRIRGAYTADRTRCTGVYGADANRTFTWLYLSVYRTHESRSLPLGGWHQLLRDKPVMSLLASFWNVVLWRANLGRRRGILAGAEPGVRGVFDNRSGNLYPNHRYRAGCLPAGKHRSRQGVLRDRTGATE